MSINPLSCALVAVTLAACGGKGDSGSAASSGAGGNNATGAGGTTMVVCDSFPNVGTVITPVKKAGPPPAMTGGTLVEGTYVKTNLDIYNGSSQSTTHKDTLIFTSGTAKNAHSDNNGPDVITAGTYTTGGTALTLNIQCPKAGSLVLQYTATATTLQFIAPDSPNKVESWVKK